MVEPNEREKGVHVFCSLHTSNLTINLQMRVSHMVLDHTFVIRQHGLQVPNIFFFLQAHPTCDNSSGVWAYVYDTCRLWAFPCCLGKLSHLYWSCPWSCSPIYFKPSFCRTTNLFNSSFLPLYGQHVLCLPSIRRTTLVAQCLTMSSKLSTYCCSPISWTRCTLLVLLSHFPWYLSC